MSKIDLVVLGLLQKRARHGYEIYTHATRQGLGNWLKVKKPSIYKALQRLEENGYISVQQILSGKHPPRKIYKIEPGGSDYFLQLLKDIFRDSDPAHRQDFWQALRFVEKKLTRAEFLQVIAYRKKLILGWQQGQQKKISEAMQQLPAEEISFVMPIMHQQFDSLVAVEIKTLEKLETAARLAENNIFFASE